MVEEIKEVKKEEDWMQKKWRPAMGWMYMIVCFFDMVIFPILWALIQTVQHQQLVQWNPLSLQGAGLFHIAMGAVLGIAAFGRTQEKIAGSASNAAVTPAPSVPVSLAPATPMPVAIPKPILATPVVLDPNDPPTRNTRND
jgi:hypothetical protein